MLDIERTMFFQSRKGLIEIDFSSLQDHGFVTFTCQMRYSERRQDHGNMHSLFHLTAIFGLSYWTYTLLLKFGGEALALASLRDGNVRTPLSYAAEEGQTATRESILRPQLASLFVPF
jgi:hypothetical protein